MTSVWILNFLIHFYIYHICTDEKQNQTLVLRLSDSYIAILCRKYEEYSIYDPHARNSNGDTDCQGSAELIHLDNPFDLTTYENTNGSWQK